MVGGFDRTDDTLSEFFKNIFRTFFSHPAKYFQDFFLVVNPFSFGYGWCITLLKNCTSRRIDHFSPNPFPWDEVVPLA